LKGSLGFGLAIASLIAFPWLVVSVASNLEVASSPFGPLTITCAVNCPGSQAILPGAGQVSPYALDLYLALLAALFIGISYYAWRHDLSGRRDSLWSLPMAVVVSGIVYLLVVIFNSFRGISAPGLSVGQPVEAALSFVPLAIILALGVTSAVWALQRHRRTPGIPPAGNVESRQAANVIHGALASLRRGTDPRSVIINCYRSLTEILQKSGAVNSPAMTAREFELSSQRILSVRRDTVHQLTGLFEIARYSNRDVSREEASVAEATLSELRFELDGTAGQK